MKSVFEFNTIYIVESLPENEQQTGEMLYNDIVKRSSERTGLHYTKLLKIDTKDSLLNVFVTIKHYTLQGFYPFIHFEIHGSIKKNGLILRSGEIVLWKELANLTRGINIITKNNLVISLATCYGAYFLNEIKVLEASPFCGCVSTTGSLFEDEIITRFTIFFETLFENTNFDLAVEKLNTSEEIQNKFRFLTAEAFFEDSVEKIIAEDFNPKHVKHSIWVNQIVTFLKKNSTLQNLSEKKLQEIAREQIAQKSQTFRTEFKKVFLLLE